MARSKNIAVGLALLGLLISGCRSLTAAAQAPGSQQSLSIDLTASSGATIEFRTQNGQAIGDIPPEIKQIPHLVLHRNGELTAPDERAITLAVRVPEVPVAGITLTLAIETQHNDPDGGTDAARIQVWQTSRRVANPGSHPLRDVTETFAVTFGPSIAADGATIPTPTDYFRVLVTIDGADTQHGHLSENHAFLMETEVIADLAGLAEATPGAAPDALIVRFCDMVPFRHTGPSGLEQLRRSEIPAYVRNTLVPQMVEAVRVETNVWGFPWHEAWRAFFPKDGENLCVSLGDGETWYHGLSPQDAHAGIAFNVGRDIAGTTYESLTDQLVSGFYHELFHNLQRDLALHYGGHGDVAGVEGVWHFFYEGSAAAAASVGMPHLELAMQDGVGHYLLNANRYLVGGSSAGGLNTAISEAGLYVSAPYWRFLAEQCGGMQVVREALIALYSGDVVDIRSGTDAAGAVPDVLDQALAAAGCPFTSFEESRLGFAQAIYSLRVSPGRCETPADPDCEGLLDPAGRYAVPPVASITFSGEPVTFSPAMQPEPAGIPSSFGIDYIEINVDRTVTGRSITIEITGKPGAATELSALVWTMAVEGSEATPIADAKQMSVDGDHLLITTPSLDWRAVQRLALILIRTDAQEAADPVGAYTVRIQTH